MREAIAVLCVMALSGCATSMSVFPGVSIAASGSAAPPSISFTLSAKLCDVMSGVKLGGVVGMGLKAIGSTCDTPQPEPAPVAVAPWDAPATQTGAV